MEVGVTWKAGKTRTPKFTGRAVVRRLVGLVMIKMWVFRSLRGTSAAHAAVLETRRAAIAVSLGKRMVDSVVRSYNPRGITMGNTYI